MKNVYSVQLGAALIDIFKTIIGKILKICHHTNVRKQKYCENSAAHPVIPENGFTKRSFNF